MSLDMRLFVVSIETLGSDGSESMAVGLSGPLGGDRATGPANTAAYVAPPPDCPGCQLPAVACSPVNVEVVGRGTDPAPGDGRLLAGSIGSPELASSSTFLLPGSWEPLVPLPNVLLLFPAGTAGFFFRAIANLNSLRRAGETFQLEIVFIKSNWSCLSIMLRQEHSKGLFLTPPL